VLRLIWRLVRLLLVLLFLGLGLYLGGPFLLPALGHYLITSHPLAKADLVVVLSGEPFLRVPEAARIYHEGLAPEILLPNQPRPRGQEDLRRLGIRYPDAQEISLELLETLRVPKQAIHTLEERSDSTQTEMQAVSRFLPSRPVPVRTLIVVTSKAHSTRAYKIFADGMGPKIRVLMRPVPADPLDPDRWWKDRQDRRQVLHEYEALLDVWRQEIWRRVRGEASPVPPPIAVR
jgi:uncharacterized SAM-binding protein YcdF (DUF218 family)